MKCRMGEMSWAGKDKLHTSGSAHDCLANLISTWVNKQLSEPLVDIPEIAVE